MGKEYDLWFFLLLGVVSFHIVVCPYTKESFNVQAVHDVIYNLERLYNWDHHTYPGVVPRTFLGPVILGLICTPFELILNSYLKIYMLYLARFIFGAVVVASISRIREAISKQLGEDVGVYYMILHAVQFHLPFYFSRFLPNTFALIFTNFAIAELFNSRYYNVISLLAFAGCVYRSELILLALPLGVLLLIGRKIDLFQSMRLGIVSVAVSLLVSVPLDSHIWRKLIWPELEVLYFNTFLNKSHEWGTSPFYWYFLVAIPKALHVSLIFIPPGLYFDWKEKRILLFYSIPILIYLVLYSFLPHKELRFIFYVLPFFNLVAAYGLSKIVRLSRKFSENSGRLFRLSLHALLLLSFAISCGFLYVSYLNYPGGAAFHSLHEIEHRNRSQPLSIHIGVDAAMSGVSRFGEFNEAWSYSKAENLKLADYYNYDYVIANETMVAYLVDKFTLVDSTSAFQRVETLRAYPFVKIITSPQIFTLKHR